MAKWTPIRRMPEDTNAETLDESRLLVTIRLNNGHAPLEWIERFNAPRHVPDVPRWKTPPITLEIKMGIESRDLEAHIAEFDRRAEEANLFYREEILPQREAEDQRRTEEARVKLAQAEQLRQRVAALPKPPQGE